MNAGLWELAGRAFRGRLVRRLRLLRQPRYLLASLAGLAYMVLVFSQQLRGVHSRPPGGELPAGAAEWLPLAIGLALAAGLTVAWIFASSKPALPLTEAEIHFLLPAPLARRQVIAFALWKQQVGILVGAIVVSAFRGVGPPGQRLARFFSTWALFTLFDLHVKGINLWKARLREVPAAAARRQVVAVAGLFAAFWALFGWSVWQVAQAATAGGKEIDLAMLGTITRAATAGLPGRLLTPFAWIGRALFGDIAGGWLALYLGVVLFAHFQWVLRSRGRFEEASLERAKRQLARQRSKQSDAPRRAVLRSGHREPFPLPPQGRPEIAILWKNLAMASRVPVAWRAAALAVLFLGIYLTVAALGAPRVLVGTLNGIGVCLLIVVPLFASLMLRNDLRTDLKEVETLRPWPLAGWRLVAAELGAPVATAWTLLVAGFGLVAVPWLASNRKPALAEIADGTTGPYSLLFLGGGSVLGVGMAVALLSITVQNLAILTFPAWLATAPQSRRNAALTGQRILLLLGHVIAMVTALIPAAVLAGAVLLGQWYAGLGFSIGEVPLLALLIILPVLAEVALLVRLAGMRWDRLDPSREILDREE